MKSNRPVLSVVAAALLPAMPSMAQAPQAGLQAGLEEIVVTARKREETLQDIPLTVQALSGETLEDLGIDDLAGIQTLAPGVALFQNTDRSYGQVFLRGMSSVAPVGDTTRELASIFIDGVNYVGAIPALSLDNLERVEIVKGPQSALYGRSTFSGAINFVTRTPGDELGGKATVRWAEDDEREFSAALEGPLLEGKLSGRIHGRLREFEGQYTNALDGSPVGEEEDRSFGVQLYFTPLEWLSARLNYIDHRQEDGPAASQLIGRQPTHNCGPFPPATRTFPCGEVEYTAGTDGVALNLAPPANAIPRLPRATPGVDRDFRFASLNVEAALPAGLTLTYLGGYTDESFVNLYDFDRTATDSYWSLSLRSQNADSHELRLASAPDGRITWLAGLFTMRQANFNSGTFINGTLPAFGPAAGTVGLPTVVDRELENDAVFGSVTWNVVEQLALSLELRRQRDDSTNIISPTLTLDTSTYSTLPRFIIDYKPREDLTFYFNYAEGTRPVTTNNSIAALTPANQQIFEAANGVGPVVDEENVKNYEIGSKWRFDRGTLNAAVFHSDWTDQQGTASLTYDFNGNGVIDFVNVPPGAREFHTVSLNAGELEVNGVELEAQYLVTDRLTVSASAAYTRPKFTGGIDASLVPNVGTNDPTGQYLGLVPRTSATATGLYVAPFGSDDEWFARTDVIYVGSRYADSTNLAETGDSLDVNVRAGVRLGSVEVAAFVENLFDDETVESLRLQGDTGLDPFTFNRRAYEAVLPKRRQVGITASVRF